MISFFNIPPEALIDVQITKKQFGEKVDLSAIEKRALREDVQRITMKALLQTRTIGVARQGTVFAKAVNKEKVKNIIKMIFIF